MTPAERAAALSARIHREMRKVAVTTIGFWHDVAYSNLPDARERGYFWAGLNGFDDEPSPFARLGAELRAIALGNREGAK